MGRNKGRACRDGDLPAKRDTPVRTTVEPRQKFGRLRPRRVHAALPEVDEEETPEHPSEPVGPVTTNNQPACSKTASATRSAAWSDHRSVTRPQLCAAITARRKPGHRASPAAPPVVRTTPEPEPFKCHGEVVLKEKEQDGQNLAVTPESVISSSEESDAMFSSDDDDCYSSAFSSSNTFPEMFRRENDAETETFCSKAQHLGLHPIITNSTLLDVSCARSIQTYQPPDLSAINNSFLSEKCEISNNRGAEGDTEIKKDSDKDKCKTPAKLTRNKPTLCKKVVFKSPVVTEYLGLEVKHITATKCTIQYTTDPVQTLSPADQMTSAERTSIPGEMNSKDDTLLSSVKLKRPVKGSAEKAKFFDFISDRDEDTFFQMVRERSVRLKSAPLFPLTAAKHTGPAVWRHFHFM